VSGLGGKRVDVVGEAPWTTRGEADVYAFTAVEGHDWSCRSSGWGVGEFRCSCGWESGVMHQPGGAWVNHLPLYELGERASSKRLWAEVQRLRAGNDRLKAST